MHSGFPDVRRVLSMDIGQRHPTPELDDAVQAQIARIIDIWQTPLAAQARRRISVRAFHHCRCVLCAGRHAFRDLRHPPATSGASYTQRILALAPMQEWEAAAKAKQLKTCASAALDGAAALLRRLQERRFHEETHRAGMQWRVPSFAPEAKSMKCTPSRSAERRSDWQD
jgi:hypothetical protein